MYSWYEHLWCSPESSSPKYSVVVLSKVHFYRGSQSFLSSWVRRHWSREQVNWISQGSIASSRGLSLASLFPSLQHKAADCCPHCFNISLSDWEQSMTFLFFLPYWRAQILIPWKYLSLWACLYKFSPWFLQVTCCKLILESPGREGSWSDQEEAESPPDFMYEMFQVVPISKKLIQ